MLLGAALVAIGVLAAALADRIRGLRVSRDAVPRERTNRAQVSPAAIPVIEPAEMLRAAPTVAKPRQQKVPAGPKTEDGSDDVIAALVAAGYKKPIAAEAAWACSSAERATVEDWTRAALRRCARGAMS